jgi:uncharacterized protein (DUF983 family)
MEYVSRKQGADGLAADVIWTNGEALGEGDRRPVLLAMTRGARLCCPNCGKRTLFAAYIKVSDTCSSCGEELHHHRADDAPPYFTIFIVAHIVVALLMTVELTYSPPIWLHLLIWLPMTVILSLLLLPAVKGAIVGLQWALRMHGFGLDSAEDLASRATTGGGA